MVFHTDAADHFEKIRRLNDRIEKRVHKDDLDDFFKAAYHILEITEKDPNTNPSQKAQAAALRPDPEFQLCREIANKQKHFTLNPKSHPNPQVKNATVGEGYGAGRYGASSYGVGEQSVTINLNDGTSLQPGVTYFVGARPCSPIAATSLGLSWPGLWVDIDGTSGVP